MIQAAAAPAPPATYIDWGVIHISLTNTLIIVAMVLLFALAIALPFPAGREQGAAAHPGRPDGRDGRRDR